MFKDKILGTDFLLVIGMRTLFMGMLFLDYVLVGKEQCSINHMANIEMSFKNGRILGM